MKNKKLPKGVAVTGILLGSALFASGCSFNPADETYVAVYGVAEEVSFDPSKEDYVCEYGVIEEETFVPSEKEEGTEIIEHDKIEEASDSEEETSDSEEETSDSEEATSDSEEETSDSEEETSDSEEEEEIKKLMEAYCVYGPKQP